MTVRDMRSVHAKVAVLLLSLSAVLPLLLGVFMAAKQELINPRRRATPPQTQAPSIIFCPTHHHFSLSPTRLSSISDLVVIAIITTNNNTDNNVAAR